MLGGGFGGTSGAFGLESFHASSIAALTVESIITVLMSGTHRPNIFLMKQRMARKTPLTKDRMARMNSTTFLPIMHLAVGRKFTVDERQTENRRLPIDAGKIEALPPSTATLG